MRTVLIVDDNELERKMLAKILSKDYIVIQAENGKEAIETVKAKEDIISAIVLDVVMPEMDGYEVLKRMQGNSVWSQIPVIVCTVLDEEAMQDKALELGAYSIINKPFRATVVLAVLRNSIRMRETSMIINSLKRDKLTKLLNRETFLVKAEKLIMSKESGYYILSCFDIENFKVINDQYGVNKGDLVLKHVATALNDCAEAIGGICCRFAADNFAFLYPYEYKGSTIVAETYRKGVTPDCIDHEIKIRIGRYHVNDKTLPVNSMFDRATLAEESIKNRYDICVAEYSDSMHNTLLNEQHIVNIMYDALHEGQFVPWFQPQYNHATGAIIGAEALVRWKKPNNEGYVFPNEFIPIFERNGFIYELDKVIWENSCFILRRWMDEGRPLVPISVNVSRHDIYHEDFIEFIASLISRYEIPIEFLRLEITESAFSASPEQIVRTVKKLVELGFTIEIDDFGSGYSSLNTLKDVPAQVLKLDMKFMTDDGDEQRGGSIIESVVRMAKWLGMSVIAEGVEEKEQADFLKSIGCYYIQGYYYSRPIPLEDYEKLLNENKQEVRMTKLQTVENYDNNKFWNPKSIDSLVFNSYVGGASIFEYHNGKAETIRATDRFRQEFGERFVNGCPVADLGPEQVLDENNLKILYANTEKAISSHKESTCEVKTIALEGGDEKPLYLRCTVRVIARTEDCYLCYSVVVNITEMRIAEEKAKITSDRIRAIMDHTSCGITAVILQENGEAEYLFVNDRYFDLVGYTREQYHKEGLQGLELMHPDDFARYSKEICLLKTVGQKKTFEFRAKRRDEKWVWLRADISVINLDDIETPVQLTSFTDITSRKEADEQLVFLNEMAGKLLAQPNVDEGINNLLRNILVYFNANRAYIFEINSTDNSCNNTYEVCDVNVTPEIGFLQHIPYKVMKLWFNVFEKNNYISIENVSELDDNRAEEKATLIAQNIKSLVAAPIRRDGKLIGFIGVDDPRRKQEQVGRLAALGDYISVMLMRRDLRTEINDENQALITIMNGIPGGFARFQVLEDKTLLPLYHSKGFLELVKMSDEDIKKLIKTNPLATLCPDDVEIAKNAIATALIQGEISDVRYRLLCGDGSYINVVAFGKIRKNVLGETFLNVYYTHAE